MPPNSRFYWGMKLMLIYTADGTVTGFGLANPKLVGERELTCQLPGQQPANRPEPGTVLVADQGFAGEDFETFPASDDLRLLLAGPARKPEKKPRPFPHRLRQPVEAIIWT